MIQLASLKDCRIFNFTPLIFVIVGSILTTVGFAASLEIVKDAGPVVMIIGGLLFILIPISCKRSSENSSCEGHLNSCEQNGASPSDEGSICQQGPIHQVELWIPSEVLAGPEIVPPSYEESVNNNSTEVSSTVVNFQDTNGFGDFDFDKTSFEPPSDKERIDNVQFRQMSPLF